MAKLTPVILNEPANADGKWNVKIRLAHKSKSAYIQTEYFVEKKNLMPDKSIKSKFTIDHLTDTLKKYKDILTEYKYKIPYLTHLEVKDLLENYDKHKSESYQGPVMFLDFCKNYMETVENDGTADKFKMVYFSLKDYVGPYDIDATKITTAFLRSYEAYLRSPRVVTRFNNGKMRARKLKAGGNTLVNVHMTLIKIILEAAKDKYNDEDEGILIIPNSPFRKYKIANVDKVDNRDYTVHQIKKIIECEVLSKAEAEAHCDYVRNQVANDPGFNDDRCYIIKGSRGDLSRDLWLLSFYLCGMNTVDMYKLTGEEVGRIEYNRTKTKGRRTDEAFISVKIIEEAAILHKKYAGKLSRLYCNDKGLNYAIHMGMKMLRRALGKGFEELDLYSARHSFATIAYNECGYSVADVGRALNHGEGKSVTNKYIRKNWSLVDKIQEDVVSLFKQRALEVVEAES